jgi:hypothetical protein
LKCFFPGVASNLQEPQMFTIEKCQDFFGACHLMN